MSLEPAIEYINKIYNNPLPWNDGNNTSNSIIPKLNLNNLKISNQDNIIKSIEFFKNKGYSKYVIAGLIGNFKTESEFSEQNISKIASDPANNAHNIGIAQWQGDRFKELKNKFPNSYNTLESQLEFVHYELQNKKFSKGWNYNNIKNKTDITEITHEISKYYEGSSFDSKYLQAQQGRINNAIEIFNKFL